MTVIANERIGTYIPYKPDSYTDDTPDQSFAKVQLDDADVTVARMQLYCQVGSAN